MAPTVVGPPSVAGWLVAAGLAVVLVFLIVFLVARDRRDDAAALPGTTTEPDSAPPTFAPPQPPSSTPPTTTPPTTGPGTTVPPSIPPTTAPQDEPLSGWDPIGMIRYELNPAPVGPPTRIWGSTFPTDFDQPLVFAPRPTELVMFTNPLSGAYALDPQTGAIEWDSASLEGDVELVGINEERAVIRSSRQVWVVDTKSGDEVWRERVPDGTTIASADGLVVISEGGVVQAFDERTGRPAWNVPAGFQSLVASAVDSRDVLVAGNADLQLVGPDGQTRWQWTSPGAVAFRQLALVGDHVVAWSARPGGAELTVLDRETGEPKWQTTLGTGSTVNAANEDLLVVMQGAQARGLDLATGEERWQETMSSGAQINDDHDGLSVETDDRSLLEVRRLTSGSSVWSIGSAGVRDVAVGARIVMLLMGEEVVGLDVGTGTELWRVQPEINEPVSITTMAEGFVIANGGGEVEGWRLGGGGGGGSKV